MSIILRRIAAFFMSALLTVFGGSFTGKLGCAVINVDFDNIIGEMNPVHGINRMPEYKNDSDINARFTEANITSCRMHDIACADMYRIFPDFSRNADDETAYDFAECDKVVGAIVDTGMMPFFRFGISYSDPVKQEQLLQPPTDYQKWAEICEHIIMHYNYGWADGFEYGIEYWEIWNEPDNDEILTENHFWLGTQEQFFELYDTSAKYLKAKFPEIKIGGYGSCGFYALTKTNAVNTGSSLRNQYFITFFENFLDYAELHGSPMDFFSWHSYTDVDKNKQYIGYVREKLANAGYENVEIICNEWNCIPTENSEIDRGYGANQTAMLIMFQNEKLDMAHFYCADASYGMHSGMFVMDKKPSTAYYGFWAFGQLYAMGSQADISGSMPKNMYAAAASDGEKGAVLIANASYGLPRMLSISAKGYDIDKCYTVNDDGEWTETDIPGMMKPGTVLYITFNK